MAHAIFAAGCFWGVEASFSDLAGVKKTTVGYTGGHVKNPDYHTVCSGTTGHAEAVLLEYDENIISYEQLLNVFWHCHNPTTLNRQGPDIGSQYRSAIFYTNDAQQQAALSQLTQLETDKVFANKIVTEILPASEFYPAEEYHQQYLKKKGLGYCGIVQT